MLRAQMRDVFQTALILIEATIRTPFKNALIDQLRDDLTQDKCAASAPAVTSTRAAPLRLAPLPLAPLCRFTR
jgi:hypothetical protein